MDIGQDQGAGGRAGNGIAVVFPLKLRPAASHDYRKGQMIAHSLDQGHWRSDDGQRILNRQRGRGTVCGLEAGAARDRAMITAVVGILTLGKGEGGRLGTGSTADPPTVVPFSVSAACALIPLVIDRGGDPAATTVKVALFLRLQRLDWRVERLL